MSDGALTLDEAVIGAGEAPPSVRIEFRTPLPATARMALRESSRG